MKGATTEPCVVTKRTPINKIVIIKGASQYFFLTFMKSQISLINSKKAPILENPF